MIVVDHYYGTNPHHQYCTCGCWITNCVVAAPFMTRVDQIRLWEAAIPKSMLKSWRIWTRWKRELPIIWDMIPLPSLSLAPIPIKPRMRERRHVLGHSPRVNR